MRTPYIVDTSNSPAATLRSVPVDRVALGTGFWAERFAVNRQTSLRDLWDLLADPEAGHVVQNFRIAAGAEHGTRRGTNWQDAWLYKWIEAASVVFRLTGDSWLKQRIDEGIELIRAAQEKDGYVGTQTRAREKPRYEDPREHEVYTMGHLITAAVIHRRMTGEDTLYEIAVRVADHLHSVLGKSVRPAFAHNPSAVMGLAELYRESRDRRYLDTASTIVDTRGANPAERGRDLWHREDGILGTDQIQDRTPIRESAEVVGHNVFFTYLFSGAADVHIETADETLWEPLERLWRDLVYRKMNLNGGVSPMGHGLSPDAHDIVVESVGKPYFLPHEDSYNETCGQIGNLMWNYRMLLAKPHGKFADMIEHEIYNGILSGVDLSGRYYWYRNQLRFHADRVPRGHNDMIAREKPGSRRICCPTNVVRTIAEWRSYLYGTDDQGIWVHQYAASSVTLPVPGGEAELEMETDYPWDGEILLRFASASDAPCRIVLRIPAWANGAVLRINGDEVSPTDVDEGYIAVARTWKAGDEIVLSLSMSVRLVEADPRSEHCRNQVAVMRGPILYCLESTDLPEAVDFDNVLIPSDITLTVEPTEMPYGTQALVGTALARSTRSWDGELYRELRDESLMEIPIRLIPYYAWANRGLASMSVWLPMLARAPIV
jgi:hypothetical protein